MSSTLNDIATFLSKPIPLGLMLVFFFVSLAVFSLFLGRVEARNRQVQLRYQEQIYALTQQRGQSWAGGYEPMHYQRSGGAWLGWLTVLVLLIGGGVVLHASQRSSSSELVVPKLAGLNSNTPKFKTVKPAPVLVKEKAQVLAPVPKPVEVPTVVTAPEPAPVPEAKPVKVAPALEAAARQNAQAPQAAQAQQDRAKGTLGGDQEIERMLAQERKRAARRRQARRGGGTDRWQPERPRNRRATPGQRSPSQDTVTKRAPAPKRSEQPERRDELLPPSRLPKKRRRRLKLDRSNDPLGSL